jgi:hypothetical protein
LLLSRGWQRCGVLAVIFAHAVALSQAGTALSGVAVLELGYG